MPTILSILRRLFLRRESDRNPVAPIVDDELRWLFPPDNLQDADAWDEYWNQQLAHGFGPPMFDMFCDERGLIRAMTEHGMRSILCAGNGISMEPRALAAAGFDVVALDVSPRALEVARAFPPDNQLLDHFLDRASLRPGGHVEYVTGNILDPSACPGPFDVVIERRTAQNYPEDQRPRVLAALADRLSQEGILFTHCHDGGWRPPAAPRHVTSEWCREQGWPIWDGATGPKPHGRVAMLFTSTG